VNRGPASPQRGTPGIARTPEAATRLAVQLSGNGNGAELEVDSLDTGRTSGRLTGWMTPDDTRAVLAGAGARSGVALATDQSLVAVDAHHDIARPILLAHLDRPSRLVKRAAVRIRRMRRLMPLGDRRATRYTERVIPVTHRFSVAMHAPRFPENLCATGILQDQIR